MNSFKIEIDNIQNVSRLVFEVDLECGKIICIVGKNGAGKTTFIKSIANLLRADTFKKTSSPYIFNHNSKVSCLIDSTHYTWAYKEKLQTIDSNDVIPDYVAKNIIGELPLPYGERFNFFQKISNIDKKIREKYITKNYSTPTQLIDWYKKIYNSDKFNKLQEVDIDDKKYYLLPQANDKYIREDYFSSGEYFILSIYRLIQQQKKLIVIDELDISLDAGAQVHLIKELRDFCKKQSVTLIFTTHSLAIMKMLEDNELFYFKNDKGVCAIEKLSYNYIKSILYQFEGWDKYILTEDKVLLDFITWQLKNYTPTKKYRIIKIGTANSVIRLMQENQDKEFLSAKNNVISVLDGDQKGKYPENLNVIFLPFESAEKELKKLYVNTPSNPFFGGVVTSEHDTKGRAIFIAMKKIHSQNEIFEFITNGNQSVVHQFQQDLQDFINR